MAELKLDTKGGGTVSGGGTETIHVMPVEYYGAGRGSAPRPTTEVPSPTVATGAPKKSGNKFMIILIIVGLLMVIGLVGWLILLNYQSAMQPTAPAPPPVVPAPVVPEPTPVIETEDEMPIVAPEPEVITIMEPIIPPNRTLFEMTVVDSDSDGLTDAEEMLLGTGVNQPDTDGDGYLDGEELISLYDPTRPAPAELEDSDLITVYVNPVFGYDVFYPRAWVARALDRANAAVIFASPREEFVSIRAVENTQGLSLREWFMVQYPDIDEAEIVEFTNVSGMSGVWHPHGFHAFFGRGQTVYIISFSVGLKDEVFYPNLFRMMVESFIFTSG